jgi:hypothetical protein
VRDLDRVSRLGPQRIGPDFGCAVLTRFPEDSSTRLLVTVTDRGAELAAEALRRAAGARACQRRSHQSALSRSTILRIRRAVERRGRVRERARAARSGWKVRAAGARALACSLRSLATLAPSRCVGSGTRSGATGATASVVRRIAGLRPDARRAAL